MAHSQPKLLFRHLNPTTSSSSFLRLLFTTPEQAATSRRHRLHRLHISPPPSPFNPSPPPPNPNSPKLPDPLSSLFSSRLNLHNKILKLIKENDLQEAALYTRHSVYSNCRPTIYTVNAVMMAQLRATAYPDLLSLHRFVTQAGIAPNVVTYNLVLEAYMASGKVDIAMEYYKVMIGEAPFSPIKATYRVLVKGLVENGKIERASELKDEMLELGIGVDPVVYSYLMLGRAMGGDGDGVFEVCDELKERLGGEVLDGVVYGGLMRGYFLKGLEKEAMECCEEAVGEDSKVRMSDKAYESVLDALSRNGKFHEAVRLFDRMLMKHNPPMKLTVNVGSYNVVVDGYCTGGRFKDAIKVFKSMSEKKCKPDTLSYNNLIGQLCKNGLLIEAEELYNDMSEKGVSPDVKTFSMLMDTCFKEDRPEDGAAYFKTMVEAELIPRLEVYDRLIDGLVKAGKVYEAKSFFDMMASKLRMNDGSYENIMNALLDVGKHEEVLGIVGRMLREDPSDFTDDLQEFVRGAFKKEGREDEVTKVIEEVEREKAEAAAKEREAADRAKESARLAVASLIPSKLFGNKDSEAAQEASVSGDIQASQGEAVAEESSKPDESAAVGTKSDGDIQQVSSSI